MPQRPVWTQPVLTRQLTALGLTAGDCVFVHSSLKAVGWLADGPDTMLAALRRAVGPQGTVAVPTHCFDDNGVFDPQTTDSLMGALTQTLRQQPDAHRSLHASHSAAAVGRLADWLTAEHDPHNALGYHSPMHRVYRMRGKILLLGVDHTCNTMLHLAESLAGLPYVILPYFAYADRQWVVRLPDGRLRQDIQAEYPGCSNRFMVVDGLLTAKGIQRIGTVGQATCRLIDAAEMVNLVVAWLQQNPTGLLCRDPQCPCCPRRWTLMRRLGLAR